MSCLRGIVGYGLFPAECVTRIRAERAITVQGSHGRGFADGVPFGSSARFRWIAEATAWASELERAGTVLTLVGHTHLQFDLVATVASGNPHYVFNPESVGQPKDGDPRAAHAVIGADRHITSRRCAYDIEATVTALRATGVTTEAVDVLAELLRTGTGAVPERAESRA